MPVTVRKLDISKNPQLSSKSYQLLSDTLLKQKMTISHLSFEGNDMGDESCRVVCDMITRIGSVVILNLSKCNITCAGAEHVAILLRRRDLKLNAILLNWNKIMGKGSVFIATALEDNTILQILDISFNSLGSS